MKIVVDIGHPSQAHFFKHFIKEMQKKGHQVLITVSDKDIAIDLLRSFGFDFVNLGSYGKSLLKKATNVLNMDIKMLKAVSNVKPDIFLGFGSVRAAHAAWILRKPCIIFDGDNFTYPYYKWFASTICTFSGFYKKGKKVVSVLGYKELAYLHPKWFNTSQPADVTKKPISILRFTSRAFHDLGKKVFDNDFKIKLANELSKYSDVYISSEALLPDELEKYRLKIKLEDMHTFLSGANLLVTDSGTMTTEAAMLGIPVIRCNSFIGQGELGIFKELENKYGMIFSFKDAETALKKAVELAQTPDSRIEWEKKRKYLIQQKIDVTSFMVWFVEQYPRSIDAAEDYYNCSLK